MHPKKYTLTLAMLALLGLWACDTLIDDFEYDKKASKLVVNAILCPDSIINIHIGTSMTYNPPSTSKVVENAVVEVFENNQALGQLSSKGQGFYTLAGIYPQAGASYKVVATAGGYESVWAETTIPHKVENLEVEGRMQTYTNQEGYASTTMEYLLTYKVPFTKQVFYGTTISRQRQEMVIECEERETPWYNGSFYETDSCYFVASESGATQREYLSLLTNSSLIKYTKNYGNYSIASFDDESYNEKIYFSNQNYSSNKLSLTLRIDYYYLLNNINNEITIWTDSFDKVLYNFMYSLAKIDLVGDDPFAEKVSVYSNVNGGLGIFGSSNSSSHVIRYDQEFIDSITPKY